MMLLLERLISTATGRVAHLGQQAIHVVLECERDAVADAARIGDLDRPGGYER